jgi:hypothetical protein
LLPYHGGLAFGGCAHRGGLGGRLLPYLGGLAFSGCAHRGGLGGRLLPYLGSLVVSSRQHAPRQPEGIGIPWIPGRPPDRVS